MWTIVMYSNNVKFPQLKKEQTPRAVERAYCGNLSVWTVNPSMHTLFCVRSIHILITAGKGYGSTASPYWAIAGPLQGQNRVFPV